MKKFNKFLFLTTFFLFAFIAVDGKDWRGITPLRSTIEDVRVILNTSVGKVSYGFETENERVFFHYKRQGKQDEFKLAQCKVPVGTVLGIEVYPKKELSLSVFKVNTTKFEKLSSCSPNLFSYYNQIEGLTINADDKFVGNINYSATAEDINYFECPKLDF